jgi:hypothetical protein
MGNFILAILKLNSIAIDDDNDHFEQQSAGRHGAPFGHNIMIPNQSAALTP